MFHLCNKHRLLVLNSNSTIYSLPFYLLVSFLSASSFILFYNKYDFYASQFTNSCSILFCSLYTRAYIRGEARAYLRGGGVQPPPRNFQIFFEKCKYNYLYATKHETLLIMSIIDSFCA